MSTSNLAKYVEEKNVMLSLFGRKQYSISNPLDLLEVREDIECDLSPENLTCDGERPMSQVRARKNQLEKASQELEMLLVEYR